MAYSLKIIIASTRPRRKGPYVAQWITELARQNENFETEVLDLKEINLPFFDEPQHPDMQNYTQQHTKDWSNKIAPADAFIFVIPEYNYGYNAPLKNALDFLFKEWAYKPAAIVSYGGTAGGTRAVSMLKQVMSAFPMIPVPVAVSIPFFRKHLDENYRFTPDERLSASADKMFKELLKWTKILKTLRESNGH